jgi:hypothetical protein
MGCLVALAAWISPRFVLVLLWLFTSRLTAAFHSGWEGVLGFLFVPYATVFYALVYRPGSGPDSGVHGFGWVLVAVGLLFDLSSLFFGRHNTLRYLHRRGDLPA